MMSKSRPILFSDEMVRAILEERKTQTRRVMKVQPIQYTGRKYIVPDDSPKAWHDTDDIFPLCPYGVVSDRLWVRETWADVNTEEGPAIAYRADGHVITWHDFCKEFDKDYGAGPSMNYKKYPGDYTMWYSDLFNGNPGHSWKPSIHMPRWASRITLEVTEVRVERLQDISDEDAHAEGFEGTVEHSHGCDYEDCALAGGVEDCDGELSTAVDNFQTYWDSLNAKNPAHSWAANPWVWVISFKQVEE